MEGFKNVKKGTNVAAQATGLSVGTVFCPLMCSQQLSFVLKYTHRLNDKLIQNEIL